MAVKYGMYISLTKGLPAARNTGIAHAQGVYIQLLDADDLLLPKRFEGMVATFCKQPDADIVYSDMRYFLDGDTQKWFYSTGQLTALGRYAENG
jgi:glycosyltransferase involved in cell wall biosynthesis